MSGISHTRPNRTVPKTDTAGAHWPLLVASSAVGIGLYVLTHRKKTGAALVATGVFALKIAGQMRHPPHYKTKASFAINCSPDKAYRFWRNLEDLPRFMRHVQTVKQVDDNHFEWTVLGPMEARVHWTAEIVEDRENEKIAWRSLPGSEIANNGSIEFSPMLGGRGTYVRATIEYLQPAGKLGRALLSMMGKDPQFTAREDLRRFKSLLESGEVPTTLGQPHGPRGLHGHGLQVLLREKQNLPSTPLHPQVSRTA